MNKDFLLLLAILLLTCLVATTAYAQTPAASACDPNYFESLKSRAWLEAQREITQNQNLIPRPDSVLEYSCFDNIIGIAGNSGRTNFSDNPQWGATLPTLPKKLDAEVNKQVGAYLDNNFGHTYRGGRSEDKHTYRSAVSQISGSTTSYSCSEMNDVWQLAKCANFGEKDHDGFFTFDNYAKNADRRELVLQCGSSTQWGNQISRSTGDTTPWEEVVTIDYHSKIYPDSCAASLKITTGLTIKTTEGSGKGDTEIICIKPGCYYNGKTCTK